MAQPQIPSVTIELEDNKANVAIDDVTPEFLQLIFDLEITPKILKNSAGLVIPIIKQKLHLNETYTIVTSLGSKSRKNQKIQSSVVSPPKYEEKSEEGNLDIDEKANIEAENDDLWCVHHFYGLAD